MEEKAGDEAALSGLKEALETNLHYPAEGDRARFSLVGRGKYCSLIGQLPANALHFN